MQERHAPAPDRPTETTPRTRLQLTPCRDAQTERQPVVAYRGSTTFRRVSRGIGRQRCKGSNPYCQFTQLGTPPPHSTWTRSLSPGVSDAVLNDYRRHVTDPIDLLSSREREVLQMIAEGKTNKEIATVLNLSVYTVDAHRGRIMEKLNVHRVTDLVRFAVRSGLVD